MIRRMLLLVLMMALAVSSTIAQDAPSPEDIALEAIANAGTYLNLSGLGLSELPAEVGRLNRLEALHVQHNYLFSLPPDIGQMLLLVSLWAYDN
ncbi:MAG: hypothetical protein KC615_18250, partial [Anaerolineae bacterium]|nr:hypothetical protein [Anaerolineae bacterium]